MKAFIILVESEGSDCSKGAIFSQSVDGDFDLCGAIKTPDLGPLDSGVEESLCVLNLTANAWPVLTQILPDSTKPRWAVNTPEALPVCVVLTGSGQKAKQMKGAAVTLAWSVPRAAFKANLSKESLCISHQDSCSDYISPQ